jgi:hypothetical protein
MTTSNGVAGRLRAEAVAYREPGTDLYPEEANAGTARLLDEAADALDAAEAQVTRLTYAMNQTEPTDAMVMAFQRGARIPNVSYAEQCRNGLRLALRARAALVDNPSPARLQPANRL